MSEIKSVSKRTAALESAQSNADRIVMIRHKGGRADAGIEGFGSVASTSQTVSSPMPPPPSPALPPGVPSSSSASAVPPTDVSDVPRGVKRELGGDVVRKGGVKSRRVATITKFEDGRNVMVKVEQDIQMVKGNLVKGSVAFADRELGGLGGGFGDGLGGDGMSGVFGESSGREDPSSGRERGGGG